MIESSPRRLSGQRRAFLAPARQQGRVSVFLLHVAAYVLVLVASFDRLAHGGEQDFALVLALAESLAFDRLVLHLSREALRGKRAVKVLPLQEEFLLQTAQVSALGRHLFVVVVRFRDQQGEAACIFALLR